ncbi:glycine/sarcosine/betaine reductase selenoprotein B family protein [Breoghania sp.]|uniref:glycine/sarcosine/betaine reductase selenoprotein B family protein n=1 Tax=Breoghania sp. TaxID=2065378 RepID=UPI0029C86EA2|nr:glycine/sarcosine/betaine reductase selenoprotein B family protein [Breoghania sp.]
MSETNDGPETFESFKKSFFYGSRSDLSFKFLSHLSDGQAADFFQGLLSKLVDAYDDGNAAPIYEHVRQGQVLSYAQEARAVYETGPFTPMEKPLSRSRLMLLTSSGHFVQGDDPEPLGIENMTQTQAEQNIMSFLKAPPTLSTIAADTAMDRLVVRHGGYDVRGARKDHNVSFPLQRLRELAAEGLFAELSDPAFSFVGACSQTRLNKITGPEWVRRFKAQQVDAALLVPV